MKKPRNNYPKYTTTHIHKLLSKKWFSEKYKAHTEEDTRKQAEFCPYYVEISGKLGMDWGIIVNPLSSRFGEVVFEHDFCECPNHDLGFGDSDGVSWIAED